MKDYHKREGKVRCTLKVDLMKAYDSINWEFIFWYSRKFYWLGSRVHYLS